MQGINPTSLALRQVLEAALETPGFLDQGGTLAFGCQHAYPHNSDAFLKTEFEPQLKGADACVVAVACDLGLKAEVRPLYLRDCCEFGYVQQSMCCLPLLGTTQNFLSILIGPNFAMPTVDVLIVAFATTLCKSKVHM